MNKLSTLRSLALAAIAILPLNAVAQDGVTVTGSVMSDILIPQNDSKIGTEETSDWALTNTYVDVQLMSNHIDAGMRFEYTDHPLPGYESDFGGWGVPNAYVKGKTSWGELTAGSFYEQFGSGFILRTYEERSLGIDNSLVGGRLVLTPMRGVTLKALAGKQRQYWRLADGFLSGADVQLELGEWIRPWTESGTQLMIGASWVNKYESDDEVIMTDATHRLFLPAYVNAFDLRAILRHGAFGLLAEYAWKTQDPSAANGYIYRQGKVAMLSASYSKRGMSLLLQAKRSDCMNFRSQRTINGTSSFVNHLPAFTLDHTYTLAALYPYATNADGEWAYQAEAAYKFKRHTALGGKYGTDLRLNFSHVHAIARHDHADSSMGSNGYGSAFWKWGKATYYQDLNVQMEKKLSSDMKLTLMYMNQYYNKTVVEGEGGMVHSDIFVAEGKYRFNSKYTLRAELQYLTTDDDQGDWAFALAELSVLPHWMFTVSDEYNCGETGLHYYQLYATYNYSSHRLQLGYGRTRAGYNCSGGVCRYVPASKGFTLSYNYNF